MQNPIRGKERDGSSAERGFEVPAVEFRRSFLIEREEDQGDSCAKFAVFPGMETGCPRPTRASFEKWILAASCVVRLVDTHFKVAKVVWIRYFVSGWNFEEA
jgi:hypothetical protein